MSQIEVERFLGRIITDDNFRAHAESSLEKACFSKGFTLSPIEMSFLHSINYSLVRQLSESIDDSIKRS